MGRKTTELTFRSSCALEFWRSGSGMVENTGMYLNRVCNWRSYRKENVITRQSSRAEKERHSWRRKGARDPSSRLRFASWRQVITTVGTLTAISIHDLIDRRIPFTSLCLHDTVIQVGFLVAATNSVNSGWTVSLIGAYALRFTSYINSACLWFFTSHTSTRIWNEVWIHSVRLNIRW